MPPMARYTFAIYAPPAVGMPWLAVTLNGEKPVDAFGCPSQRAAEHVIASMKVRWGLKERRNGKEA
jgi:hypothetical protein